jgi:hypothetical protein
MNEVIVYVSLRLLLRSVNQLSEICRLFSSGVSKFYLFDILYFDKISKQFQYDRFSLRLE